MRGADDHRRGRPCGGAARRPPRPADPGQRDHPARGARGLPRRARRVGRAAGLGGAGVPDPGAGGSRRDPSCRRRISRQPSANSSSSGSPGARIGSGCRRGGAHREPSDTAAALKALLAERESWGTQPAQPGGAAAAPRARLLEERARPTPGRPRSKRANSGAGGARIVGHAALAGDRDGGGSRQGRHLGIRDAESNEAALKALLKERASWGTKPSQATATPAAPAKAAPAESATPESNEAALKALLKERASWGTKPSKTAAVSAAPVSTAQGCEAKLRSIAAEGTIRFETASATLDAESHRPSTGSRRRPRSAGRSASASRAIPTTPARRAATSRFPSSVPRRSRATWPRRAWRQAPAGHGVRRNEAARRQRHRGEPRQEPAHRVLGPLTAKRRPFPDRRSTSSPWARGALSSGWPRPRPGPRRQPPRPRAAAPGRPNRPSRCAP